VVLLSDEIPESLVKQCIKHIKNLLLHIYTASLKSSIFPQGLKTVKVNPLYKKRG
jgi:hypothetical protein